MKVSTNSVKQAAKQLRKQNKTQSLTEYQNQIARKHGYKSYKHLRLCEENFKKKQKLDFALGDNYENDDHFMFINNSIEVFVRPDGVRGLRALRSFSTDEVLFQEDPLLYVNIKDDPNLWGLPWVLTSRLAQSKEVVTYLREELKFRESFKPKLDKRDRQILSHIVGQSGQSTSYITGIYNLVCTYNVMRHMEQRNVAEKTVVIGQRLTISKGLAYANHSCSPNAVRLPLSTIEHYQANYDGLQATREIAKEDEIFWPYLEDLCTKPLKDRRKCLKNEYGFDCFCTKCKHEIEKR